MVVAVPFRLDTEENPYPPSHGFKEIEYKDATFSAWHRDTRHESAQPCETEDEIGGNDSVV